MSDLKKKKLNFKFSVLLSDADLHRVCFRLVELDCLCLIT